MKKLTLLLFLAACGDNIHPAPDARFDYTDVTPPKPDDVKPEMPAYDCVTGVGACAVPGEIVDGVCDAVAKPAQPETCNAVDDDCDGFIDEALTCDAGVPDSGIQIPDSGIECDDSHEDLNGHEHKCQHDKP